MVSFGGIFKMKFNNKLLFTILITISLLSLLQGQDRPNRVGTTSANFLEYGFGSAGTAMGDAVVSMVNDVSSIYWNPAGLAFIRQSEGIFVYQPWIVDINSTFAGAGIVVPGIGTLALGMIHTGYGEMEVTTVERQEGTGEIFTADDYAISLSYARNITPYFSFGATMKYISSSIWHMEANAMAVDLGVIVQTPFFTQTDDRNTGLKLGMSISNYGTRMQYDGLDGINPIDILPRENGNFGDAPGQFRMSEWELPLIFRIGISYDYNIIENHKLTVSSDALHPNNSAEYVNMGVQYELTQPTFGKLYLRGGYKALWLPDSEFGLTLGAGLITRFDGGLGVKINYAFREFGILGDVHSYSIGLLF
jgi:opacity protein-like surface antigen